MIVYVTLNQHEAEAQVSEYIKCALLQYLFRSHQCIIAFQHLYFYFVVLFFSYFEIFEEREKKIIWAEII